MPTLPTKDTKPSPCSKTLYAGIKLSNQRVQKKKKIHTRRGKGGEVGRESEDKLQIAEIQTQENKHLGQ